MNFVFFWLEVAFKAKLARNIELMRKVPAFEHVYSNIVRLRKKSFLRLYSV